MDRRELREALAEGDIPVLLMVLVHLTGEERWIEPPYRPRRDSRIFADESGQLPAEICEEVRDAASEAILAADPDSAGAELDDELLARMMSVCVGEPVRGDYVPVMLEEMGLRPAPPMPVVNAAPEQFRVLVIGAGISGVCAAVRLSEAGIPSLVVDKNADVGGTWFENVYPDAGVDTPNHFYSYSFTPGHDWTHYYSKQPEILSYIRATVERFGVRELMRFGVEVTHTEWDEQSQCWRSTLRSADGQEEVYVSNALMTGVGGLNRAKLPAIEGIDDYEGTVFHTSAWPQGTELDGMRVALIGTGASAVQIARTTAERVEQLTIYQRSPQWITPNAIYRAPVGPGKRRLLLEVPFYAAWYRFTLFWRHADSLHAHIQMDPAWEHPERAVSSRNDKHREFLAAFIESELAGRPDLLAKAMPTYPPYGKRMLLDNDWFKTLRRKNVELVAEAVARLTPSGVETAGREERPADVVAFATGFHTTQPLWPMEVLGRDGVSLHELWAEEDPRAYLGVMAPGFPNLFMLLGPHTGLGHGGSAIFHIEAQVRYAILCIAHMLERRIGALEPDAAATSEYNDRVDAAHEQMVFSHPGMSNWYKNRAGRVIALSPWRLVDYWAMTREPRFEELRAEPVKVA